MSNSDLTNPSQILQHLAERYSQCRSYSDCGTVDFYDLHGLNATTSAPFQNLLNLKDAVDRTDTKARLVRRGVVLPIENYDTANDINVLPASPSLALHRLERS